ncbi:hypothetical protein ACTMU2_08100 [Cupriavidus basilensis]
MDAHARWDGVLDVLREAQVPSGRIYSRQGHRRRPALPRPRRDRSRSRRPVA